VKWISFSWMNLQWRLDIRSSLADVPALPLPRRTGHHLESEKKQNDEKRAQPRRVIMLAVVRLFI
jgi:hypothetical protein